MTAAIASSFCAGSVDPSVAEVSEEGLLEAKKPGETNVLIRAAVWLSVPLYSFPHLDPGTQVITASVMAS